MGYKSKIYSNMLASLGQARMLDDEKLRRLIDSSYDDAHKILADYGYGEGETDVEQLISGEMGRLISFVNEDCADETVKNILLAKFVFNNAKAEYKNKLMGKSSSSAIYKGIELGNISEGEYEELPTVLADALVSLDDKRDMGNLLPQEIDSVITRAMYTYVQQLSKGNSTLASYYTSEVDMLNLITLLRCRKLNLDKNALASNILVGGSLDVSDMELALDSSDDSFEAYFAGTVYAEVFANVLSEPIGDIEVNMDNYLFDIMSSGGDIMTSNAPFISYFFKQIIELRMIKMVVMCIRKNASGEVRRRLRNIYD